MNSEQKNKMFNCVTTLLLSSLFFCGEIILGKFQIDYSKIYYSCDPTCSQVCPKLQDYLHTFGMINLVAGSISLFIGLCISTIYISSLTNCINPPCIITNNNIGIIFSGCWIQFVHIYTLIISYVISYHFSSSGECYYCRSCYPKIYMNFFQPLYILVAILFSPCIVCIFLIIINIFVIIINIIYRFIYWLLCCPINNQNNKYYELNSIEINYK